MLSQTQSARHSLLPIHFESSERGSPEKQVHAGTSGKPVSDCLHNRAHSVTLTGKPGPAFGGFP